MTNWINADIYAMQKTMMWVSMWGATANKRFTTSDILEKKEHLKNTFCEAGKSIGKIDKEIHNHFCDEFFNGEGKC